MPPFLLLSLFFLFCQQQQQRQQQQPANVRSGTRLTYLLDNVNHFASVAVAGAALLLLMNVADVALALAVAAPLL